MKTALIVVDVQKFFLVEGPDELPDNISEHLKSNNYDTVAFTVFKNNPDSNFNKSLEWGKCDSDEDAELPEPLKKHANSDNIFTRATYSGFSSTNLNDYLKKNQIEKVVLCGVDTDACVLGTAFSAFDLGYVIDVNFDLTFSGGDLEKEAQNIMKRSLIAHPE